MKKIRKKAKEHELGLCDIFIALLRERAGKEDAVCDPWLPKKNRIFIARTDFTYTDDAYFTM